MRIEKLFFTFLEKVDCLYRTVRGQFSSVSTCGNILYTFVWEIWISHSPSLSHFKWRTRKKIPYTPHKTAILGRMRSMQSMLYNAGVRIDWFDLFFLRLELHYRRVEIIQVYNQKVFAPKNCKINYNSDLNLRVMHEEQFKIFFLFKY